MIIVASVSCIYGLGSPEDDIEMMVGRVPEVVDATNLLKLVDIQYERNDFNFTRAISASAATPSTSTPPMSIRPTGGAFGERSNTTGHQPHQRLCAQAEGTRGSSIPPEHYVLPRATVERRRPPRSCVELDGGSRVQAGGQAAEAQRLTAERGSTWR